MAGEGVWPPVEEATTRGTLEAQAGESNIRIMQQHRSINPGSIHVWQGQGNTPLRKKLMEISQRNILEFSEYT